MRGVRVVVIEAKENDAIQRRADMPTADQMRCVRKRLGCSGRDRCVPLYRTMYFNRMP